jgi:ribosomal protein S27E
MLIQFNQLEVIGEDKITKPEIDTKDLKKMEPGYKIPISEFIQIGQWCDSCQEVEAHVYSPTSKKIRCLKCKRTKQLK